MFAVLRVSLFLSALVALNQVLDTQYRMHPRIREFPSRMFYGDTLLDGPNVLAETTRPWHDSPAFQPLTFYDVPGKVIGGGHVRIRHHGLCMVVRGRNGRASDAVCAVVWPCWCLLSWVLNTSLHLLPSQPPWMPTGGNTRWQQLPVKQDGGGRRAVIVSRTGSSLSRTAHISCGSHHLAVQSSGEEPSVW